MDIKYKSFPFLIKAETKTSKAGNSYTSIGLGQYKKLQQPDDQGNNYETKWLNFIDKRDLLVLAAAATSAYNMMLRAEQQDRASGDSQPTPAPAAAPVQDDGLDQDIPF